MIFLIIMMFIKVERRLKNIEEEMDGKGDS
jgi:hypothetical protein